VRDPFKVLGVAESSNDTEIKDAYRQLARQLHPDLTGGDLAKEERLKKVNTAYAILGDTERRERLVARRVERRRRADPAKASADELHVKVSFKRSSDRLHTSICFLGLGIYTLYLAHRPSGLEDDYVPMIGALVLLLWTIEVAKLIDMVGVLLVVAASRWIGFKTGLFSMIGFDLLAAPILRAIVAIQGKIKRRNSSRQI
jgi:hypothetical protein